MTLEELNHLASDRATSALARCCGSARWAGAVAARRPFRTRDDLLRIADEVWWSLGGNDWLDAFSQHPRIGERAAGWAHDEQSGVRGASSATVTALTELNRDYEKKFGHVFLIFATGKSADEMLVALQNRLGNAPDVELRTAAAEQALITRLRLEKLLAPSFEPSPS